MCPSSDAYCLYDDGHGFCYSCNHYKPAKEEFILDDQFTYEYFPWRGVSKESFQFYDAKVKIDKDGKPISIGYRYPNDSYKVRQFGEKQFHTVGEINKAGLFGRNKFAAGSHKCVTITEGELDAISLWQVLRSPVVSVQSSGTAHRDCVADRSWLQSFERVYIAFDGDRAGQRAADEVARLFDYNKVFQVKFSNRKDANEYLKSGEEWELKSIWENAKKYLPETIVSSFEDFRKILKGSNNIGVPYPFPTLNDMTYGIRKGETVLIKAQEKVGKTELMHAIEYQLLTETQDNVGAIFLEEPKRRHLEAIAGIRLKKPVHLPDVACSEDEIASALEDTIGMDERLHVYSHFGSDDPEVLLDTVRFLVSARGCSYILLDHITMAVSGLAGKDERLALEYLATRLEMMVKELNFALIMVSHVNDMGQTRGSHYITKVADITIDAARDMLAFDPIERNTIHLSIPYNRFCGRTGPAGDVVYDVHTGTLTERMPQ